LAAVVVQPLSEGPGLEQALQRTPDFTDLDQDWPQLETPGHPFAVGRGLDHNSGAEPGPEHGGEALGLGADALLDDRTPPRQGC